MGSDAPERRRLVPFAAVCVAMAILVLVTFLVAWLPIANVGLRFGYYGRLNRALASLRATPNVVVTSYGANYDVTLEEFEVEVRVADRWVVRLSVPEDTDLERARHLVVRSCNGVTLGSIGPHPDWSGLAFSLGPTGDLNAMLGTAPKSIIDAVASIDRIAAYIVATPLEDLRARHELGYLPAGSVNITIAGTP